MNTIFGFNDELMKEKKMFYTATEIARQPESWKSIYKAIDRRRDEIQHFMKVFDGQTRIIFTGAGSSGFIGDALAPIIRKDFAYSQVESIHTTDIVANPEQYLVKDKKTLMVSFGRSGNSPESVAALQLAEAYIGDVYHMIITCNPKGKLAQIANERTLILTFSEIEDLAFAMTSSVTGMMLAAYAAFGIKADYSQMVERIAEMGTQMIQEQYRDIFQIMTPEINRLVVLGSANLYGAAREGALKSTELTAGQMATRYDTPMGFRHGPKSFLNEKTVILFAASNNPYTRQYDLDMLRELSFSKKSKLVVISEAYDAQIADLADVYLYGTETAMLPEAFTAYMPILLAQIFSLQASLMMGCTPDNPFPTGEVNRVVQGVVIHPLQ